MEGRCFHWQNESKKSRPLQWIIFCMCVCVRARFCVCMGAVDFFNCETNELIFTVIREEICAVHSKFITANSRNCVHDCCDLTEQRIPFFCSVDVKAAMAFLLFVPTMRIHQQRTLIQHQQQWQRVVCFIFRRRSRSWKNRFVIGQNVEKVSSFFIFLWQSHPLHGLNWLLLLLLLPLRQWQRLSFFCRCPFSHSHSYGGGE